MNTRRDCDPLASTLSDQGRLSDHRVTPRPDSTRRRSVDAWEDYRAAINNAAEREDTSTRAAEQILRGLPRESLHGLLVRLTQIELRRAHDLYELTKPRPQSKPMRDYSALFAEVYDHPKRQAGRRSVRLNSKERQKFRRWCHEYGHDFNQWLDQLIAAARDVEMVKLEWIPGYRTPTMEEIDREFMAKTMGYINEFAQTIRLEVTAELLGSTFKLPDGRKVTWRDATIDDHEAQLAQLGRTLGDTAERAAMHQRALEMLRSHDAKSLGELETAA